MTRLRRHVVAVVAALFALAVGIALGGGPLSYVPDDGPGSATDRGEQDEEPSTPLDEEATPSAADGFAEEFAGAAAARLYDKALRGHPTVVVAMPGVQPDLLDAMLAQIAAAGGGLTGVFGVTAAAVDPGERSLVDSLGSQLMTQLPEAPVDPAATTYARLGQLVGVAVATPIRGGRRADDAAQTVRASLSTAGLLSGPGEARRAPLVLVLLPPHGAPGSDPAPDTTETYLGLSTGMRANAAGVVLLGDTGSGAEGLLADLRRDPLLSATVATVDGGDTVAGRVAAMLALIATLDGRVGAYGASGSDGALPLT